MSEKEYKIKCENLFKKNTVLLNQQKIDAEQIRALQKQNRELTDELTKKSDTNHQLVEQLANLEAENADLKCECRRCVYSDTFCIVSDYGKDKNGICDHFKDVFEELTLTNNECKDMREELKQRIRENQKLCEQIEKMKNCGNCRFSESDKLNGTFCHREGCFVVASAKCKLWEN